MTPWRGRKKFWPKGYVLKIFNTREMEIFLTIFTLEIPTEDLIPYTRGSREKWGGRGREERRETLAWERRGERY